MGRVRSSRECERAHVWSFKHEEKAISEAFTEAIAVHSMKDSKVSSVEAAVRAYDNGNTGTGLSQLLLGRILREVQAAGWNSFALPHVVGFCMDAIRVGNPMKDLLASFLYNCSLKRGIANPPQV